MRAIKNVRDEPTTASVWQCVAGSTIDDHLLEWPPDVFALTETLLERSEAHRFALSPPDDGEWPPSEVPRWPDAVVEAGRQWSRWAEDRHGPIPDLLAGEWKILRDAIDGPFTDLRQARNWRLCLTCPLRTVVVMAGSPVRCSGSVRLGRSRW
jgi:hypothetical protein